MTPVKPDKTTCYKRDNHGQCCCNCANQRAVNGHPWVTGTSILKPTGMYVCTAFLEESPQRAVVISHKHGACETWSK